MNEKHNKQPTDQTNMNKRKTNKHRGKPVLPQSVANILVSPSSNPNSPSTASTNNVNKKKPERKKEDKERNRKKGDNK